MVWPDIVILGVLLIGTLKGWKRGFVSEIGGAIAMAVALWAAFHYNGSLDALATTTTHLAPGSAHVLGLIAFAFAVYVALLIVSLAMGRVAKLPVLGLGNSAAGALVGTAKGAVFVWAVLYVALFFPLSGDVRNDLRRSPLVAIETQPNERIDGALVSTMPWFIRPFVGPLVHNHRV